MGLDLIGRLYDYHRWANRRLFEVASGLGEAAQRELGSQFSFPTVTRMFGHLYGADWLWLARWKGSSPSRLPGAEFTSLAALRPAWDIMEAEQQAFLASLAEADLARTVDYRNVEGKPFRAGLGVLLMHVATHGVHHRSEIATMITVLSGSPPDSGLLAYELTRSGQIA